MSTVLMLTQQELNFSRFSNTFFCPKDSLELTCRTKLPH